MNLFEVTMAVKQTAENIRKSLNQTTGGVKVTADFNPSYIHFSVVNPDGMVRTYSIQIIEETYQ